MTPLPLLLPFILGAALISASQDSFAAKRSHAAKAEFKRLHPCPATGRPRGACPGWQIDHRTPLKCGGPDHHSNMQWLTVEQHKEKTRMESAWCRKT